MEHEVFVPVPARLLRRALADPARVARAVPGLQQDAGGEPVTGRLKMRIGGHSITYRGTLRVRALDEGSYAVEGDATESRGSGSVKFTLTLRLRDTDGGSTVTFDGTATAEGRVTELPPDSVHAATTRLLTRFTEHLCAGPEKPEPATAGPGDADSGGAGSDGAGPGVGEPEAPRAAGGDRPATAAAGPADAEREDSGPAAADSDRGGEPEESEAEGSESSEGDGGVELAEEATEDFAPSASGDFEAAPDADDAPAPPLGDEGEAHPAAPSGRGSRFDADVPPSSLDPLADEEDEDDEPPVSEDFAETAEPPAEAAHARRTMIGRSAEEVDHAPPRGRYAPVPAPLTVSAGPTLRWAAPAAALIVASVIVVGRALRRRR
ncbi:SRPBCC family protein [Streptomyces sp. NPDC088337]|uniref:SRPBCC family protein n=1 Tax=unclassified Streptomyces TaxID=2593676 RepID=UPI002DD8F9B2|nr:SRPBCC family protein [Streptomyces sp. NBC_01788]WSB27835.1 SRPBCC domain-containing protein [Streptomyces sp. NBC_01788]